MFSIHVAALPFASISVQYRHPHNLSRAQRGVKCTTDHYGGHSATYAAPSLEKEHTTAAGSGTVTLGDKMRDGHFEGDGLLVYKERFVVRRSQVGVNKTANIEAIASLLQETFCIRAKGLGWSIDDGFPTSPTMRKHRLIWVTSHVYIEMYKYPSWGEKVEIEHWSEMSGKIRARFDFIIRNLSTGEEIGRSTSKWSMMNQDTREPDKIIGEVKDEYLAICTKSPRLAFPDIKNNPILRKLPTLKEPAEYSQLGLMPRRADIDMNKHVNNVTYYSWVLQSIPQDIVDTHELEAITIEYLHECQYSNTIDSLARTEVEIESVNALSNLNPNSEDRHQFLHLLKISGMDEEISRGRTVWRKMDK